MPVDLVPPKALAGRIDAFWEHAGEGRTVRILPDGCMDFWFDLESGEARVIGAMTRAELVRVPAGGRYFGVRFRSGAASDYVAETMREYADRTAPLADTTHAARFGLAERVAEADTRDARIAVVAEFVLAASARERPADPRVTRAVRALRAEGARIHRVAASIGLSERQLERLFGERVGVSPKRVARIARLERALALFAAPPRTQAELAVTAGYADESHLIREFRALAGGLPAEVARERRVGSVQVW